ncbi:hypothetical protein LCGC14_2545710, partial [marine sediment metagenome]
MLREPKNQSHQTKVLKLIWSLPIRA